MRAHAPEETPVEPPQLEEGALLARKYRLVRTAGFGGMAQLWVAKNESTGAEVCVKILVPERTDDESVERFRREAYAAARLSHRAIVRVFDLIELGSNGEVVTDGKFGALAIVMELLHGETLADLLMKKDKLPLDEALDIAIPFISALAHAHRAGVVHRDLKPDNIFLAADPDGQVIPKVLDFGVSKLEESRSITQDGVMLGTPSFMSPEQARGARNIDARSDVFSAGIVLYMMLAGKNPFESDSFHSVVSAILERQPPPIPDLPDGVSAILEKALQKAPAARYADATELGIALRKVVGRNSVTDAAMAPPSSATVRAAFSSAVSVPPVGSSSLVPGETETPPSPESSASLDEVPMKKTSPMPFIVAAIALAAVAVLVLVVRGGVLAGGSSSEVVPAASHGSAAPVTPPPPPPPPSATQAAAPTETAAPQPSIPPSVTATQAPAPPRPRPPTSSAPSASPSATGRPTPAEIARDPGF